ncbi:ACP S-malonyltransferase [bacterium]|nr:ACP S-malonyltransferase [bacterium]
MAKTAFIFPGQGSQYAGMGREFVDNFKVFSEVFEEASARLGFDLLKTVTEGTDEELMQTEVTQPAILTVSKAILEVIRQEFGVNSDFTAGLSLGEYTALVHAGALNFADAVAIAKERGRIMQEAVPAGVGAMAPIVGLSYEEVAGFIKEIKGLGVVEISNFNSPSQVVVSGNIEAVQAAVDFIKKNAKTRIKALFLPVSAPFHTSMLKDASEKFAEIIGNVEVSPMDQPVLSNVTGLPYTDISEVKPALVKQFYSTVLWKPSVDFMLQNGVTDFVEIGPGTSLSGLVRKTAAAAGIEVKIQNVENMETFKNLNF